jgi:hypothetical protein
MNSIRKTTYERILEVISLVMLGGTIFPLLHFGKLAKNTFIPVHFGISGQVDGWGNPYLLWLTPAITVVIYIALTYFDKNYKKINYPVRIKNEEMANVIYRLSVRLIRRLKLVIMMIFCYVSNVMFLVAQQNSDRLLCLPVFYLLIGGMFTMVLFYLIKMMRLRKGY